MTSQTDFPGVPGTATIKELLERPDRAHIKVRRLASENWCLFPVWIIWHPSRIVYVQTPPLTSITLPSGRNIKRSSSGPFLYRIFSVDLTRSVCINLTDEDHDALAPEVKP